MTSRGRFADVVFGRKQLIVLIAFVAALSGIGVGLSAQKAVWEGWVIDRLFQLRTVLRPAQAKNPAPVVVVGLDQVSLDSEKLAVLPRVLMTPFFAKAGQGVIDAGALVAGFDFVFAYSADDFQFPGSGEASLRGLDVPFKRFLLQNRGKVFIAHTEIGVPHRSFSAVAGAGGVRSVLVVTDSDGIVRRHTPDAPLVDSPDMIDAVLAKLGSDISEGYVAIPTSRLATSTPYLSLVDVLTMLETEEGKEALKDFVGGRAVLFGSMLPYEDEHLYSDRFLPHLPVEKAMTGPSGRPRVQPQTAGVLILADIVGAAVSGRVAKAPPHGVLPAVAILFAVAGSLAGLFLPLMVLPAVAFSGIVAGLGVSLAGLEFGVLFAPGVAPVACVGAMVVSAVGKVGILQRKQRSLVRLFSHYLAPDVIRQMAQSEQLPELGGDTRHVVVGFIDIAGFTKMSENLADREVVRVVNSCFDAIGQVITAHQGYIDKYIGDAIMAVWNAPNTVDNPERAAVDSACEIVRLLDRMRDKTGQPALDLRVALHAGHVLVGDIGGEYRRSFTVMGTTVNTASRIEAVAKENRVRLAFSKPIADKLPDSYPKKAIWTGLLRGLSKDTTVFTLDTAEMFIERIAPAAREKHTGKSGGLRKRSV